MMRINDSVQALSMLSRGQATIEPAPTLLRRSRRSDSSRGESVVVMVEVPEMSVKKFLPSEICIRAVSAYVN
jgi:hypothetical protein